MSDGKIGKEHPHKGISIRKENREATDVLMARVEYLMKAFWLTKYHLIKMEAWESFSWLIDGQAQ